MTASVIRTDYSALSQMANSFGQQAGHVRQTLEQLNREVDDLQAGDWLGRGAQAFYAEMDSQVLPSLDRLVRALDAASDVTRQMNGLMQQAEAQAAAFFQLAGSTSNGQEVGAGARAAPGPLAATPIHTVVPGGKPAPAPNLQDPRFKRVPPGPGAYSEAELKQWQREHPRRRLSLRGPWQSDAQYKVNTADYFRKNGYFYAGRIHGGYKDAVIEVWLSNAGNGQEVRVFRGPPPYGGEGSGQPAATQTSPRPFDRAALDALHSDTLKVIVDLKRLENDLVRQRLKVTKLAVQNPGDPKYGELYRELVDMTNKYDDLVRSELDDLMPAVMDYYFEVIDSPKDLGDLQYLMEQYELVQDRSSELPDWFDHLPTPP